jgi:conserved oligomeric Golgi complex subunit 6
MLGECGRLFIFLYYSYLGTRSLFILKKMSAGDSAASSRSVAISRKVNRLLDVTVNDQFWQILQYISDQCPEATVTSGTGSSSGSSTQNRSATNKPVKAALEDRVLALHQTYLERFSKLNNAYQHVSAVIQRMDETSAAMEAAAAERRAESEELVASVGILRAELDEIHQKEAQIKRFMEQYSLTQDETSLLRTGDINAAFLDTLNKVRTIHRSCRDLLASNHQQAAVEIMESMYLLQVTAVDRLVKHLLNTVSEVMAHDLPDVTDVLIGSLRAIEDRPAQWSKVMFEVSRVRKTAVLRRFYDLLTKGSARTGRPLETISGDVVRFFGDLFAWLHQCIAEESDLLDTFIPSALSSSARSGSHSRTGTSPTDSHLTTSSSVASKSELMDVIFEVLCKHIKTRLESALDQRKVLSSGGPQALNSAIVTYFQLDGIFGYFSSKTNEILGGSASLSTLIAHGKLEVLRTFFDLLKQATQRLGHVRVREVGVPAEVQELLRVLKSMMDHMDLSLVAHNDREGEFAPVLGAVVDPVIAMLNSQQQTELDDARRLLLKINVLSSVQSCLTGYSFTAQRNKAISDMVAHDTTSFIDFSTSKILASFGFDQQHLSSDPAVALQTLQQFYSYTATAGALPIAHIESFQSVRLRESIASRITENVCSVYDQRFHATPAVGTVDRASFEPRKLRVMLDASSAASLS